MSINCQYILNRYIMTEFMLSIIKPVVLVTGFPNAYQTLISTAGHKYVMKMSGFLPRYEALGEGIITNKMLSQRAVGHLSFTC